MFEGLGLDQQVAAAPRLLRLIDSCITQLKAQGPSRTCNESKEEGEEGLDQQVAAAPRQLDHRPPLLRIQTEKRFCCKSNMAAT